MEKIKTLTQLKDAFLLCRDVGHAWMFVDDQITEGTRKNPIEFRRTLICSRCETERTECISCYSFAVESRTYKYPDFYCMTGERVFAHDVREEFFLRHVKMIKAK